MAIEILEGGGTQVLASIAGRPPGDGFLADGVLAAQLFDPSIFQYNTPLSPAEFVGILARMVWPTPSSRASALYPADEHNFVGTVPNEGYGYCFAIFKVRKGPIPVAPFIT